MKKYIINTFWSLLVLSATPAFAEDQVLSDNWLYLQQAYDFDKWITSVEELNLSQEAGVLKDTLFKGTCYTQYNQYEQSDLSFRATEYKSPKRLSATLVSNGFSAGGVLLKNKNVGITDYQVLYAPMQYGEIRSGQDDITVETLFKKTDETTDSKTTLQFAKARVKGTTTPVLAVRIANGVLVKLAGTYLADNGVSSGPPTQLYEAVICVMTPKE